VAGPNGSAKVHPQIGILSRSAESAGVACKAVEARGSSQECSECGGVVPKTLADRIHRCPCGYEADRDVNSARVILGRGLGRSFGEGAGSHRCPKIREAAGL
jgi:transposase